MAIIKRLMTTIRALTTLINTWVMTIKHSMKIIRRWMIFTSGLMIRLRPHTVFVKTGKAAATSLKAASRWSMISCCRMSGVGRSLRLSRL